MALKPGTPGEYWAMYTNVNDPRIRFWVEMQPITGKPLLHIDSEGVRCVRLKSARNARFDTTDYQPRMAPPAGLWPFEGFARFYERTIQDEA